jgi:hypothetical protein
MTAESAGVGRLPVIKFSQWFPWKNRNTVSGKSLPGVYLLARFEDRDTPSERADPLDQHIVYIGETSRPLSTRWNDFNREAFGGGAPHSGATTYREKQYPDTEGALYLAAMPSPPSQWRVWASMPEAELRRFSVSPEELQQLKRGLDEKAPAKRKGPLNGAWVKFVERKVLLDFVLKWDKLPDCNKE